MIPGKLGVWSFGIAGFLFGISDRTIAALGDGFYDAIDLMQLFTALAFLFCWFLLYPEGKSK